MHWNIKSWVNVHLLSIGLFISWSMNCWQDMDEAIFWWFNRHLVDIPGFAAMVAIANQRWIDTAMVLLILMFILHHAWQATKRERARIFILVLLMGSAFSVQTMVSNALPIQRSSPTKIFDDAARISKLAPEIDTKDSSGNSFPSDHGIGLFTFLLFVFHRFPRSYLYAVLPMVLVLALPRIISGAHWATDFFHGSLPLALITCAWLFHTPLAQWATESSITALRMLLHRRRIVRSNRFDT